ncbi:hypothetical protein AC1031_012117 [Aphanomyces cochlioides]|nr:hypothetical protein AC1031_012117 [Aphanomyces cochlioides]
MSDQQVDEDSPETMVSASCYGDFSDDSSNEDSVSLTQDILRFQAAFKSAKPTRRQYTIKERQRILSELLKRPRDIRAISRQGNVPLETLYTWMKKRQEIMTANASEKKRILKNPAKKSGKRHPRLGTQLPMREDPELIDELKTWIENYPGLVEIWPLRAKTAQLFPRLAGVEGNTHRQCCRRFIIRFGFQ